MDPYSCERRSLEVEDGHVHGREGLVKRVDHVKNGEELSPCDANLENMDGTSCKIEEKELSIEQIFDNKKVPPWSEQITFRAMFMSMLLGIMFSIIVIKLTLTTGIIPSLNVAAGLLGYFFIKTWTKFLEKLGLLKTPFTRQENTVIQTCVVACYGIAFSGGFGLYLLAMSRKTYEQAGIGTPGNTPDNIKDLSLSWIIGFLFTVSFIGLLAVVPLRKIMVIEYKLIYPSGTATATLINGFHTPQGDKLARKQVRALGKYFTFSFLWGFFQWFFAAGDDCGFAQFPTFGLKARDQKFFFDFSATYIGAGKLAIFIFGAWAGKEDGGVLAGLAACGVMMSIVSTASDLMQDFKTGYLTMSSPRSMFVSQVIGTAMGCIIAPCTFWLFYKAFNVGDPNGEYPAPYALIYRNMAILGVEGFGALPNHCLTLCYGFFAAAIVINLIRDRVPKKVSQYIPLPMAMAIPFYLGGYFAIDMCVGTAIVFVWQKMNRKNADVMVPAVASGLICGDGVWTLPSSFLALAKVNPPICMKFLSRSMNTKVDALINQG